MPSQDIIQPFIFENADIRGVIINLSDSYKQAVSTHHYPTPVARQLGEFMAAAGLLSATLKFDGIISLQAQGKGPVSLLMADCTRHHNLRAIAHFEPSYKYGPDSHLEELTGPGTLAITIEPAQGERYQGLVAIESQHLAENLEHYFEQSEQLKTRIWLASNESRVCALFLQRLPSSKFSTEHNETAWEHILHLANTLTPEEMLELNHQQWLLRLFHAEQVRLFEEKPLQFACSCSRERTAKALLALGEADVRNLLEETGEISIDCQFCNQTYLFSASDVDELYNPQPPVLH